MTDLNAISLEEWESALGGFDSPRRGLATDSATPVSEVAKRSLQVMTGVQAQDDSELLFPIADTAVDKVPVTPRLGRVPG